MTETEQAPPDGSHQSNTLMGSRCGAFFGSRGGAEGAEGLRLLPALCLCGIAAQDETAVFLTHPLPPRHWPYDAAMDTSGLHQKLIDHWRRAAEDLGIRISAPAELRDASG